MLNKILFVATLVAFFLGAVACYYKNVAKEQERVKMVYQGNNTLLLARIKKVYDDKVATDLRNKELEKKAKEDKSFDWGVDISNSPVILELKR